jgi:hypothetical protein
MSCVIVFHNNVVTDNDFYIVYYIDGVHNFALLNCNLYMKMKRKINIEWRQRVYGGFHGEVTLKVQQTLSNAETCKKSNQFLFSKVRLIISTVLFLFNEVHLNDPVV